MSGRRNQRSAEAEVWRRWYKLARWRALRAAQLMRNPLCAMCNASRRITAATVVDHKRKHKGDPALFWDPANLQSLCKLHHDGVKQSWEKGGKAEVGADGWPLG